MTKLQQKNIFLMHVWKQIYLLRTELVRSDRVAGENYTVLTNQKAEVNHAPAQLSLTPLQIQQAASTWHTEHVACRACMWHAERACCVQSVPCSVQSVPCSVRSVPCCMQSMHVACAGVWWSVHINQEFT
jgi:hypothetical protein